MPHGSKACPRASVNVYSAPFQLPTQADSHEAHIPTQRIKTQTHPRLSISNGDQKWSTSHCPPSRTRTQKASLLITCFDHEFARFKTATSMNEDTQAFPRKSRLLCGYDYKTVFDTCDLKAGSRHALLLSIPNASHSRLGLIIAKKNVRFAVQRNRIKRVTREFFRNNPLKNPRDVIFLAKRNLGDLTNDELRSLLTTLWKKLDGTQPRAHS